MVAAAPTPDPDLVRRYDVPAPRYTSYPPVPEWSASFGAVDHARALSAVTADRAPLSLYVHIPFCRKLCTYCGCNVIVARSATAADTYLDHVALELELVGDRLGGSCAVSQLHWGGGTPTFLSLPQITRLWELITRRFAIAPDAEVAIEIDPRVTSRDQLALLRQLGFNRVSLGVQDLDPDVQDAIGRGQTVEETERAIRWARQLGYGGVNVDLVYGLPGQSAATWQRTMALLATLQPDRVALFSYAHVPQLRPHQRRLPLASLPRGAAKLDFFTQAGGLLVDAGYRPIGMDHFALPSDPLARAADNGTLHRNFQGYTTAPDGAVLGVGVSAISDLEHAYAQNVVTLPRYYQALREGRLATARGLRLTADDLRRRAVINALMCDLTVKLPPDLALEREALLPFARDGLVTLTADGFAVTPLGRLFLRVIAQTFDAYSASRQAPLSNAL